MPSGFIQPDQSVTAFDPTFERTMEIRDLIGLLQITNAKPTYIPRRFSEQIVIAVAGGVNSLYIYDVTNNLWRAASLGT